MKLNKKWLAALAAVAAAFVLPLAGCDNGSGGGGEQEVTVENIALDKETLTLAPGATGKLTATVTPDNADDKTVAWSSSDTSVATVNNDGTVTAVKEGTATITAKAGDKTAKCTVSVKQILIAVENITLNTETLTLAPGATSKLTATVTPNNADDKTVAWSSSDTAVATVGDDGMVTAVKAGTATITATTQEGGKTATCKVTVNPILVENVTLNLTTLTLAPGATGKLTATVTPDNADDKTVAWSSSDTSVATVNNDGTVTAVKEGTATITAQAGGRTATCEVTVHIHSYDGDQCTVCGLPKPVLDGGTIDDSGVLTEYSGSKANVVIPDGVTSIGKTAFKECTSLETVVIPQGVTSIGSEAFYDCENLKSVTIPASVKGITTSLVWNAVVSAFFGCPNIETVTYGGTLAQWCAMAGNGGLTYYAKSVILAEENNVDLKAATTLTIPDGVTSIGDYAFYRCTSLASVEIPASVTSIEYRAFEDCTSLAGVTIPDSVKSIGSEAFSGCTSLTSVEIPASVKSIDNEAFSGCTSLASVTIPNGVTYIYGRAFRGCDNLNSVTYGGTEEEWNTIDIDSSSGLSGKTITGKDGSTWTAE